MFTPIFSIITELEIPISALFSNSLSLSLGLKPIVPMATFLKIILKICFHYTISPEFQIPSLKRMNNCFARGTT